MEIGEKVKLEEAELKSVQQLHTQFSQLKIMLGDLELKKLEVIEDVKHIKAMFQTEEAKLIEKYGPNSVINLQSGEVTEKQDGKNSEL